MVLRGLPTFHNFVHLFVCPSTSTSASTKAVNFITCKSKTGKQGGREGGRKWGGEGRKVRENGERGEGEGRKEKGEVGEGERRKTTPVPPLPS